jgi:hypothetical protein
MAQVQNPCNGFRQAVSRVDEAWDVDQFMVPGFLFPILNCKMLDIDVVARTRGGTTGIDHFDGRLFVFESWSRADLRETKSTKSRMEVCNLGSCTASLLN